MWDRRVSKNTAQFRTRRFEGHFLGGTKNLSGSFNMSSQMEKLGFLIHRKEVSLQKLAMSSLTICRDMIQWAARSTSSWQFVFQIFTTDTDNINDYLFNTDSAKPHVGSFPYIIWNPFVKPTRWELSLFYRWKSWPREFK